MASQVLMYVFMLVEWKLVDDPLIRFKGRQTIVMIMAEGSASYRRVWKQRSAIAFVTR
jgi:hypothetical protein